jgi:hypothetical protein
MASSTHDNNIVFLITASTKDGGRQTREFEHRPIEHKPIKIKKKHYTL